MDKRKIKQDVGQGGRKDMIDNDLKRNMTLDRNEW